MKLHHKVIYMPILVIVAIFIISVLGIEYHLKNILHKRFEQELRNLASFSLSAIALIDDKHQGTHSSFSSLANSIAGASSARIGYFSTDGSLLGDSQLTVSEIARAENYRQREEIVAALANGQGRAVRFNPLLSKEVIHITSYDNNLGYIVRASLPTDSYQNAIVDLRWSFSAIIFVTIIVIVIFGLLAIRMVNIAVQKERNMQELRIVARTREITLIQTMSTMLTSADCMEDAARILGNIIPKLLPRLSGAIFLTCDDNKQSKELMHWGEDWPSEVSKLSMQCWQKNQAPTNDSLPANCEGLDCHLSANAVCVNLVSENYLLGTLYLVSAGGLIDNKYRNIAVNLAEQISYGLANLHLKDLLRNQAIRDPLTDLYNRRFMFEALEQALNRAERHQAHLAVLMIDLDYFKLFNDSYGHEAGDVVLIKVAEAFKNNLRLEDIACRYGGEEFCIICPDINVSDAYRLAEKLRACVGRLSLSYKSNSLGKITISTGVAIFPNHADSSHQLIDQADQALYQAKKQGRNCTQVAQTSNSCPQSLQ